jgi:predicted DNA-binding transcriptional regulator AlpA
VRRWVWGLLPAREVGFPWPVILGKPLTGWVVIDLDATVITCSSEK